jgi:hypothetical protein
MGIMDLQGISIGRKEFSAVLRLLIAAAAMAVMCGVAFGATPSDASLKGTYFFNFAITKGAFWSKSKSCTYKGITNTYTVNAQGTYTELNFGTATFDGKGHVTFNMNDEHQFDQAASDASISIVCATTGGITSNSGQLIYEPTVTGTNTGTYSVSSNGSGTVTLSDDGGSLDISLGAYGTNGVSTTVLMRSPATENNLGIGSAVLQ